MGRGPTGETGCFPRDGLGLRGQFSNLPQPLTGLLQCLTGRRSNKGGDDRVDKRRAGWPDGRRKFGEVGSAIVRVLTEAGGELSAKTIRTHVEQLLGAPVSRYSVSDYLLRRSKGRKPLFVRTRHGHYRLLQREQDQPII